MQDQDSNQHSKPDNTPKKESPEPKMPEEKEDKKIIEGANQQDQLEKLQPNSEKEEKAPNE